MKKIQLNEISLFRTELMGLSAILILICHSIAHIEMPVLLRYTLSFGNIGVDLFLFLSGMGMWYSLSKMYRGGVKQWYANRYMKLFVPYLITILPLHAIEYLMNIHPNQSVGNYLFGLSTLRFYVSHNAPWFIAALIPLYLLAPWFYRLIKTKRWKATVLLIVIMYLLLLFPSSFESSIANEVIDNIQFVVVRATCFVLGMGFGQAVKDQVKISAWWLVIMIIAGIMAMIVTHRLVYSYFFLTLPLIYFFCWMIKRCGEWLKLCAGFMGKISLESYLINSILPKILIIMFAKFGLESGGNVIPYLMACVLGCAIGYIFHAISDKLIHVLFERNFITRQ